MHVPLGGVPLNGHLGVAAGTHGLEHDIPLRGGRYEDVCMLIIRVFR